MNDFFRNFFNGICGSRLKMCDKQNSVENDHFSRSIINHLKKRCYRMITLQKRTDHQITFAAIHPNQKTVKVVCVLMKQLKAKSEKISRLMALFSDWNSFSHQNFSKYLEFYYLESFSSFIFVHETVHLKNEVKFIKQEKDYRAIVYQFLIILSELGQNDLLWNLQISKDSFKLDENENLKIENFLSEEIKTILRMRKNSSLWEDESTTGNGATCFASIKSLLFEAVAQIKVSNNFILFLKYFENIKNAQILLSHSFFDPCRQQKNITENLSNWDSCPTNQQILSQKNGSFKKFPAFSLDSEIIDFKNIQKAFPMDYFSLSVNIKENLSAKNLKVFTKEEFDEVNGSLSARVTEETEFKSNAKMQKEASVQPLYSIIQEKSKENNFKSQIEKSLMVISLQKENSTHPKPQTVLILNENNRKNENLLIVKHSQSSNNPQEKSEERKKVQEQQVLVPIIVKETPDAIKKPHISPELSFQQIPSMAYFVDANQMESRVLTLSGNHSCESIPMSSSQNISILKTPCFPHSVNQSGIQLHPFGMSKSKKSFNEISTLNIASFGDFGKTTHQEMNESHLTFQNNLVSKQNLRNIIVSSETIELEMGSRDKLGSHETKKQNPIVQFEHNMKKISNHLNQNEPMSRNVVLFENNLAELAPETSNKFRNQLQKILV